MEWKDRVKQNPYLKKLIIDGEEKIVEIREIDENIIENGTPINAENIQPLDDRIADLENSELLKDTGWIEATLSDNFKSYGDATTNNPQYRKIGKIVEIRGVISAKEDILVKANVNYLIFTLPEGFRPSRNLTKIMQGSGSNIWCLTIYTTGAVNMYRYRKPDGTYPTITSSEYMPFEECFTVD